MSGERGCRENAGIGGLPAFAFRPEERMQSTRVASNIVDVVETVSKVKGVRHVIMSKAMRRATRIQRCQIHLQLRR